MTQAEEGALSARALRRLHFNGDSRPQGINEARLRYPQAKLAYHANSSKSVGATDCSQGSNEQPYAYLADRVQIGALDADMHKIMNKGLGITNVAMKSCVL